MWGSIAQAGMGLIQTGISAAAASKIPDNKKHTVGPEMRMAYNMSRRRAEEGYSSAERASFEQMLARQSTTAKTMMQNVGLAGVGSAAANIMGIDALNQFAEKDSDIRRGNFQQFANLSGEVQGIQDAEVSRGNAENNAARTALGGAVSSGIGNIFGAIDSGENSAQKKQAMEMFNNSNNGDGTESTGTDGIPQWIQNLFNK